MMIYLGENSLVVDTELNFIKIEMHMISLRQAMQNIKRIWKKHCQVMSKGSKKKDAIENTLIEQRFDNVTLQA